jgi:hypothetical protein
MEPRPINNVIDRVKNILIGNIPNVHYKNIQINDSKKFKMNDDNTQKLLCISQLLLLRHASNCERGISCPIVLNCLEAKQLFRHVTTCKLKKCNYKDCNTSKKLLYHFSFCDNTYCNVCEPVRKHICRIKSKKIIV